MHDERPTIARTRSSCDPRLLDLGGIALDPCLGRLAVAARRPPRRCARAAGCVGCRARGSRRIRCPGGPRRRRSERTGPRARGWRGATERRRAHAAQRVLRRRPHPPPLLGEVPGDRRRRLRAERHGRRRAPRGRGRTTRCRRGARGGRLRPPCPRRVPSVSTAAARTFGSESQVSSISVASPSSGYGRRRVAPQKRTFGFRSRRSGSSCGSRRGREPFELGCDRASAGRRRAGERRASRSIAQSSPMSPSVRMAAAAILGSGSSSTRRISRGTAG